MKLIRDLRRGVGRLGRRSLFVALERLLPADRSVWCFCTWDRHGHTLDNPRAVFEHVKHDPAITKIILQQRVLASPGLEEDPGVNVRFVPADSLQGLYWLARAGVVLLGYRVRAMCSVSRYLTRKHLIVQLWHGIPLKRIGRLFTGESGWDEEAPLYTATVASSQRDREHMQAAFAPLSLDQVWLTGLPRNDFISGAEQALPADYRWWLGELRTRIAGRRMVLYAPTWRQRGSGDYEFTDEQIGRLSAILAAHGAVLAIRGHSNVRGNDAFTRDYGTSAFIDVNDLPDANLALRLTDVLVTDYSSIYIDFLPLGRPIIHFVYDLEAYRVGRGFLYELEEAFAGPQPQTFEALCEDLESALRQPDVLHQRHGAARALFHTYEGASGAAAARRIRALAQGEPAVRAAAAARIGSAAEPAPLHATTRQNVP